MSGNVIASVGMSSYITPSYTFTPGPSGLGTVNLSGIDNFDVKRLVAIVNQTAGTVIYSSGNSSCNHTNVSGKTITLKLDTSSQNSTDILQIIYDTGYVRLDPVFPINIDNCYVSNEVEIKNDSGNPVPVSSAQSGTWNINNVSGTVSLPTGASTESKQDTQIAELQAIKNHIDEVEPKLDTLISQTDGLEGSLSSIDGKLNSLGQKAMASSVPVVVSSDQSAIPASQSGTWNINNVSGTVSLPTGASTLAAQNTANASLNNIDAKLPALLNGRQPSETLGMPSVARQLSAGPHSADTALTVGVTRVSIYANGGSIRYSVGSSPQTASSSSHFIAIGERLDIIVPATGHIAVMRANSTNCTLELTELV